MAGGVQFALIERAEICAAQLLFSDAYCLGVELRYPDRVTGPRNLSQQVSEGYGLHHASARVMQGGLDLVFDRYGDEAFSRLVDISYNKNSANWGEGGVEPPEVSKEAWLGIAAEEGLEEVTSLPGTARATVDLRRDRLLIELDGGTGAFPWARIADGVAAAVVDGKLAGLFLEGFDFTER
ncbi:hypothetical protein [Nisaea sediminum]|uniref:hypothetical protein n=1 Tax=Nisaea sediminum TaxID=2775867 RepID=UPI00186700B7|nr:hypothetical protein [Nisaea sediminum]